MPVVRGWALDPKTERHADIEAQAQRGVGGDGALALHNIAGNRSHEIEVRFQ